MTRLKSFSGLVTITAISDDPFVDFKETCSVRCYNSFTSFGDTHSAFVVGEGYSTYSEPDEIMLKENNKTHVVMYAATEFGQNDNILTDGTYYNIEDYDLNLLKTEIEKIFAPNQVLNFSQRDNKNFDDNLIQFDILYTTDLFNGQNSIEKNFSLNERPCVLTLKKYVPVGSIEIGHDDIIVL